MANKKTNTTSELDTTNSEVKTTKEATTKKNVRKLTDDMEIEVVSLISNVSYYDSKTGDRFQWKEIGDKELLTVETLKNMYRNFRGYFTNLWLKPLDDRVVKQFKLDNVYKKYEKILHAENYTVDNIDNILNDLSKMPNAIKLSTFHKIQDWVSSGEISNVKLILKIERKFGIDLIDLI